MNHNHEKMVYTCSMHPEVRKDAPGICPECGMTLISEKRKAENAKHGEHKEYEKHAGHNTQMFLRKFWISLILTVPVIVYSDIFETLSGLKAPEFPGSQYLTLILGSIVFFYGGWIFIIGAYRELRAKLPGMMTLIAIAISAAYIYSVYAAISVRGHDLFWELTTLITVMLLGHYIEMRAVGSAQGALKELSKLLPDTAEVVRGDKTEIVPLSELKGGDIIFVRPGGKIPADGVVTEGKSEANESMITGESKPVAKNINSQVIAGTINADGALKIKVGQIGEHTFLAGIMRLIAEAQASKSRLQILSDRAAFYLTIIAISGGALTFVAWLFVPRLLAGIPAAAGGLGTQAGFSFAVERLVAVLVITCPHALGLAVPLVAAISTTLAARNGLLVRQRLALEAARKIDIVLFDKTGTLTKGEFGVTNVIPNKKETAENRVLEFAASVDARSEHFISKAIVAEAKKRGLKISEAEDFERLPGKGVKGTIDGALVLAGGEAILGETRAVVPAELKSKIEAIARQGKTIIYAIANNEIIGAIALADIIRKESREALSALKKMGVKTAMITGDSEDVASWVAKELDIDEYFARVLPQEKAAKVKTLQERGMKVAMVGDGINDAPALTQADLGIAIGAGTNVAIESAGIILVRNDPRDIVKIIKLSRLTYRKMIQNLFWATGYNVIALPLAAGVFAYKGIILEPALAALFMSLSTVVVAVNALFLRRSDLS